MACDISARMLDKERWALVRSAVSRTCWQDADKASMSSGRISPNVSTLFSGLTYLIDS